MRTLCVLALLGLGLFGVGCKSKEFVPEPPKLTSYSTREFEWDEVQRIVLMPLANRSNVPAASAQVQQALVAELQKSGRFEVVLGRSDSQDPRTEDVFASGKFDEEQLLHVKHRYQAQGVLFVQITQYSGFNPPQLGLSMLLVSPAEAVVIAAVDGLWDMREAGTLARARHYAGQNLNFPDSLFGDDRILDSPQTFQRFVAYEISQVIETATHKANANSGAMGMPGSLATSPMSSGASFTPVSQQGLQPAPVPSAEEQ